jgi:hypothetical protein
VKLSFPWTDAFRPSKKTSQANVHFEKVRVCVVWRGRAAGVALVVESVWARGASPSLHSLHCTCEQGSAPLREQQHSSAAQARAGSCKGGASQ